MGVFDRFKREREIDLPGVIPESLPRNIDRIGWAFTFGCIGFLLYFTWGMSGTQAVAFVVDRILFWEFPAPFKIWLPVVVPYTLISIAVPVMIKYGLPMFMYFDWKKKGQKTPKFWSFVLVAGGSLVIIAGSIVVQNDARLETNRGGAVKIEQAVANIKGEESKKASWEKRLAEMKLGESTEAKAAREGYAGWVEKVEIAKGQLSTGAITQDRYDRIERALSTAKAAEALQTKIDDQTALIASMPTQSAVAERVVMEGDGATAFSDFIKKWRAVALAVISDLGALFCTWLALRLMDIRAQQLAEYEASQGGPETDDGALKIEDHSNEWQARPQDVTYDENGDELIPVRMKNKVYYRRKSKKKDEGQAPLNAEDKRAPVSMFDGVPDGDVVKPQDAESAVDSDDLDPNVAAASDANPENDALGADEISLEPLVSESLTHEDQQADELEASHLDEGAGGASDAGQAEGESQEVDALVSDNSLAFGVQQGEGAEDTEAVELADGLGNSEQEETFAGTAEASVELDDPEIVTWEPDPEDDAEFEDQERISDAEALELEAERQRLNHRGLGLPAPETTEAAE